METESDIGEAWARTRSRIGRLDNGGSVLILTKRRVDVGKIAFSVALEEAAKGKRVIIADTTWPEACLDDAMLPCYKECRKDPTGRTARLFRGIAVTQSKSALESVITRSGASYEKHGPFDVIVVTDGTCAGRAPDGSVIVSVVVEPFFSGRRPWGQQPKSRVMSSDVIIGAELKGGSVNMSVTKNRFGEPDRPVEEDGK